MKVKAQSIPYTPRRTRHDRIALAARLILAGALLMLALLVVVLE